MSVQLLQCQLVCKWLFFGFAAKVSFQLTCTVLCKWMSYEWHPQYIAYTPTSEGHTRLFKLLSFATLLCWVFRCQSRNSQFLQDWIRTRDSKINLTKRTTYHSIPTHSARSLGFIQLYSPLLVEKSKSIKKQTNNKRMTRNQLN